MKICSGASMTWSWPDCGVHNVKQLARHVLKDTKLKIVTSAGTEYSLPALWSISDAGAYTFRNKLEDKAFSHGGNVVGDGRISGRTIKVEFFMHGATEQDHDYALNTAYTYFCQTNYDLYVGRSDRKFRVAGVSKITHKYQKGFQQRWSEITVSLLLADPFRYEGHTTKITKVFPRAVENAEIYVDNLGSVDTPLTFRFIPVKSMAKIHIYHKQAKEEFSLSDALLIAPATVTVNGDAGTVWRDKANSINTFSGQFLHVKPGKNLFYYTGDAGTIEISFTNRWFV